MYLDQTVIKSKQDLKRAFRQSIFDAFDNQCAYCGSPATSLDHVLPKFLGGETITSNLVPSCQRCNQNKGSQQWLDWYKGKDYHDPVKEAKIRCHIQR
jgi:5-methylcytosine-specific restriction endonuclease McrA